ncbi:MAG: hypothetical protein PHI34_05175, partial [Acidobacteriota bacterium]|nr:hypothetical protein [Acidobacteriota bacterium]
RIPDQLAKTGVFADDPLTRSIEFLEQVIDSLELYFEDHLSDYTTIRRLLVTFPTGFAPDIRDVVRRRLSAQLTTRYGNEVEIRTNVDEPEGILQYALDNDVIELDTDRRVYYGVYDFGGGTTDTYFILTEPGTDAFRIAASGGSIRIGGGAIDRWNTRKLLDVNNPGGLYGYGHDGNQIDNFLDNPQFAKDISEIKHFYAVKIPEPGFLAALIPEDKKEAESLKQMRERIDRCRTSMNRNQENPFKTDDQLKKLLVQPLYYELIENVRKILTDTLNEALPRRAQAERPEKIKILIAGNASKISYFQAIISSIAEEILRSWPASSKREIQVVPIDKPKEAVALGAYRMTEATTGQIARSNDPPMTVFIEMVGPAAVSGSRIGDRNGVIIFDKGEKNRTGRNCLAKKFRCGDLRVSGDQMELPLTYKIGIDYSKRNIPILGNAGSWVAILMNRTNEVFAFRYDDLNAALKLDLIEKLMSQIDATEHQKVLGDLM